VKAVNHLVEAAAPDDPPWPSKQVRYERGADIRALECMQTELTGEDLHCMNAAHTASRICPAALEVFEANGVVALEGLVNPGIVREILDHIIRSHHRMSFTPEHSGSDLGDMGVASFEQRQDLRECRAGIDHVIDKQPSGPRQRAGTAQGVGDSQRTLLCAASLTIGTRKKHTERGFEKSRKNIADPQTASGQAHDRIETPARLVHLHREPFDEQMVLLPGDMQIGIGHSGLNS